MLTVLFLAISVALVGFLIPLVALFAQETYGSNLEKYIMSRNPKHPSDVERLTVEYNRRQDKDFL